MAWAGEAKRIGTPYYHTWLTTDLVGLEMCAALKNAYTLAKAPPRLEERGLPGHEELPLLRLLCSVIIGGAPVEVPFDRFFQDCLLA